MHSITIRAPKDKIIKIFPHLDCPIKDIPNGVLGEFKSGAKLHRDTRPGDWCISGFAKTGSDVIEAIEELFEISK